MDAMTRLIHHTADGSDTLYVPALDEHYHSIKGARTESQHIFINLGLKACKAACPRILEIGFGTGLNALLTLEEAERTQRPVHYTTLELYPLSREEVAQLAYDDTGTLASLHQAAWEADILISPCFTLHKIKADATTWMPAPRQYDVVYFDAFAPEKQPRMWTEEVFRQLYNGLQKDGILTTYCAKGAVRRLLQNVGFRVERMPGPPQGKREVLRATRTD